MLAIMHHVIFCCDRKYPKKMNTKYILQCSDKKNLQRMKYKRYNKRKKTTTQKLKTRYRTFQVTHHLLINFCIADALQQFVLTCHLAFISHMQWAISPVKEHFMKNIFYTRSQMKIIIKKIIIKLIIYLNKLTSHFLI